jgi:hypothetical protein
MAYFHSIEIGCALRLDAVGWHSFKSEAFGVASVMARSAPGGVRNVRLATPQFRPYP